MILTCPQCATKYTVDGTKFPAAGRSVRCAKCGHVWHQIGPQPAPAPEAEIEVHHEPEPEPVVAAPSRHTPVIDETPPSVEQPPSIVTQSRVAAFAPSATMDDDVVAADDAPVEAPRAAANWSGRIAVL